MFLPRPFFLLVSTGTALALAILPSVSGAQTGVYGRVLSAGQPVPNARVTLKGAGMAAATDSAGVYRIVDLVPGPHTFVAMAIGFIRMEQTVSLVAGEAARLDFELARSVVTLNPVTVTATLRQTTLSESPVKVEVVPAAVLRRSATNNLTEVIGTVNGLSTQVDCGVCYTNNIRINGMEGPYTAVLIDGMPIMSSLSSVYGLNGINPSIIERIEIVKGPNSTLYGSEAMAGVINVITKDPRFTPRLAADAYRTSHGQNNLDFALSPTVGAVRGLLSGNVYYMADFVDENGDGFSDVTLDRRVSLFAKADVNRTLKLTAKFYNEDRFGGVERWTKADRGSAEVYGESIYTNRVELLGSWILPRPSSDVRLDFSYNHHDQDSFYGTTSYAARQNIGFANLIWDRSLGKHHEALVGATARYQTYDDNTPATQNTERRLIPGLFAQDEWRAADGLALLGGARIDHHEDHGLIFSPRAAIKWEPFHDNTIRLNAGTGFRVVNLFTEDHAALTGARDVVIAGALRPERSASLTLNVNQILVFGPNPLMIDVDLFHTRFSNKIVPDYDLEPGKIVYANIDGYAVSRGVSVSLNQNVLFDRFLYTVGVTFQNVYSVDGGIRTREPFASSYTAVGSGSYTVPGRGVVLDYTGTLTGPMRLPSYDAPFERPSVSPAYSVHNVQVRAPLTGGFEIYAALNNAFDYTQPTPLVDPEHPFGDAFDTAYVYGPIQGRRLVLGARYARSR